MNEEQIEVVKTTWATLEPLRDAVVSSFYQRLFQRDPSLRSLFPDDMREQRKKLAQVLGLLVASLDRFDDLLPTIEDLGRRHVGYGVQEVHYRKVGAALLYALEQHLAKHWDPEVQGAWTALYSLLSQVMISAARKTNVA